MLCIRYNYDVYIAISNYNIGQAAFNNQRKLMKSAASRYI